MRGARACLCIGATRSVPEPARRRRKPSSGPRVPFLPASDHKLTQLFEDLVWQVEQGVHRIEFLERELRFERATRETAKSTEEDRVERVKGHAAAMAATHSFLDDERRAFAEERTSPRGLHPGEPGGVPRVAARRRTFIN